ncbi:MAG: tetratricopeptide repeat protein [Sulfurovum sp.]
MRNKRDLSIIKIIYILFGMSIFLSAEPSVYGFDNIEDSPSISASKSDIIIDDIYVNDTVVSDRDRNINKDKVISNNTPSIESLKEQIDEQKERIDGLTTIIDGLSQSLNELQETSNIDRPIKDVTIKDSEDDLTEDILIIDESSSPIVEPIIEPKIETTPIEIEDTMDIVDTPKPISKSNNVIFSEGVTNFLDRKYDKAREKFILTDSKAYKVGASNFYLGEIAYNIKDYKNAIFYYKKSAGIDDKTSYIDTLLLHTGTSFEKSGNKTKAKAFYQNLIDTYPNNKTAILAKEKLRKL